MPKPVSAIPPGYHTLTACLVVREGGRAIEFYKQAFGATVRMRMDGPDGKVMHAELAIGDSVLMLSDENPQQGAVSPAALGGSPVTLFMYVPDVDTAFQRAITAGAQAVMPVADMFWGDRYGQVQDPFGHKWSMATHTEDVSPEEIARRAQAMFNQPHTVGK